MPRQSNAHGRRGVPSPRTGGGWARSRLLWGGAAAAAFALVAALAASQPKVPGDRSPGASSNQPISAPDFRLTLYQGAEVLGADELEFSSIFRTGKPVVLNFWAGLCPPCRAEMPDFQEVYDELGGQFILLGLDIGPFTGLGSREDGRRLLRELGITYPAGTTFEEITVAEYRVRGMPTTVFLTAGGEIFDTHIGLLDRGTLRAKLASLLQETGGAPRGQP